LRAQVNTNSGEVKELQFSLCCTEVKYMHYGLRMELNTDNVLMSNDYVVI